MDLWGLLARQLNLLGEFQVNERLCLKKQGGQHLRNSSQG